MTLSEKYVAIKQEDSLHWAVRKKICQNCGRVLPMDDFKTRLGCTWCMWDDNQKKCNQK